MDKAIGQIIERQVSGKPRWFASIPFFNLHFYHYSYNGLLMEIKNTMMDLVDDRGLGSMQINSKTNEVLIEIKPTYLLKQIRRELCNFQDQR